MSKLEVADAILDRVLGLRTAQRSETRAAPRAGG
jgi:hypothetical protein